MKRVRIRLGDLLVEHGLVTEEQLQHTLSTKEPGQKLGDALLQRGYITEQQLIEVLEFQLGIPHVSLYRYPFDETLFSLISKETAKRNLVVPLKKQGDKLYVAMVDPMDYFVINDLRLSTGFQIEPLIAMKDDVLRTISRYYDLQDSFEQWDFQQETIPEEDVQEEDSPAVVLVNQIIQGAVQQKASDIHIDPQETKVIIRYRVDGRLHTERMLPKHMQGMLTARIKIMANMDITEHRMPQDGRIKFNYEFHQLDLRVSSLPTIYGEKLVLRLLDLGNTLNDITKLGFHPVNLERFLHFIQKPHGMVLITGPTGSGKSSTLYAALNKLNSEEVNIITIEDPVEYQLEGINQIQVNAGTGMTFATGLRSILRQDPNVIMVGEIRDRETAEIAIRASLTGHLVLSTLHTNSAIGTITRLVDMGIEPFLLASSLSGVVSQRLIRRVCRDCRMETAATQREKNIFAQYGLRIETVTRGRGCPTCGMTGYKGRLAIHELLVVDDAIRTAMANNASFTKLRELAIDNQTIFLLEDGLLKVQQGYTTTEEVLQVAMEQ
ncbi:GspE/PulE family protein [Ectobacillus antri]|jgi:type IV pilus assembly protein PilB|uniref:GspE/PulE family protein n=1 Tax=Ectobacillus antri TaxID=2486280 RepID=A0ABT6H3E1_9BACI|nr:GspE/PulE family protein [Ectobacillus antri]MDG4657465.1 GspE/PulE family protein [Ectobacillus antri]MDG5753778.1 GspE/PulE family protein [Ectobacillus antri]